MLPPCCWRVRATRSWSGWLRVRSASGAHPWAPRWACCQRRRGGWLEELDHARWPSYAFAFPGHPSAIMLAVVFGAGVYNAIIAIGIFNIPTFARITRACRRAGVGRASTCWRRGSRQGPWPGAHSSHVLPNMLSVLIVQAAVQFALATRRSRAVLPGAGHGHHHIPRPDVGRRRCCSRRRCWRLYPGLAIALAVLGLKCSAMACAMCWTSRGSRKR